ncbi:hypothetical protein Q8A73_000897 [Channa argus]|nr:hypothetical protein Q8A73_000897 [Channa argus]
MDPKTPSWSCSMLNIKQPAPPHVYKTEEILFILTTPQLAQCSVHLLLIAVMKTASRAQPRSSPPLVQMRRYAPGVYPFLFPSVISSLPQLPPPSPQRLQIQQPISSGSTPSPAESPWGHAQTLIVVELVVHFTCLLLSTSTGGYAEKTELYY